MKVGNPDPAHGSAIAGGTGVIAATSAAAAVAEHVIDPIEAHLAQAVSIVDATSVRYWPMLALTSGLPTSGGYYAAVEVEGALAEIGGALRVLGGAGVRYWPMLALTSAGGTTYTDRLMGTEVSDPPAPAVNTGILYFRDNGAGKTQLVVRFPTGAIQVVATEP